MNNGDGFSLIKFEAFVAVSVLNFLFWYYFSRSVISNNNFVCNVEKDEKVSILPNLPKISPILTKGLVEYKSHSLLMLRYPEWSTLIMSERSDNCKLIVNPHISRKIPCLAVVTTDTSNSHNLLRYESNATLRDPNYDLDRLYPAGVFNTVANEISRIKLATKMGQFIASLDDLEKHVSNVIKSRGLSEGDDIVVMVVNAGEIDLFANFACSCFMHNISMHNKLVFAGSEDIVPVIDSFGGIGIYHESSFAFVSKTASYAYLDKIFVDMMWYKSFSIWLLLKLKYNVLFQDVDLVWFKDPMEYFHAYTKRCEDYVVNFEKNKKNKKNANESNNYFNDMYKNLKEKSNLNHNSNNNNNNNNRKNVFHKRAYNPDAFLSDDGQRGIRYTPFYANSGFFYLKANPRTLYFAWTIMTSFDLLHVTGSHQNIFTIELIEGLDLSKLKVKLLSLKYFPSGVKYHHDKPFMIAIRDGHETPYIFHMCWTSNKLDKLKYFRIASMWFLTEQASDDLASIATSSSSSLSVSNSENKNADNIDAVNIENNSRQKDDFKRDEEEGYGIENENDDKKSEDKNSVEILEEEALESKKNNDDDAKNNEKQRRQRRWRKLLYDKKEKTKSEILELAEKFEGEKMDSIDRWKIMSKKICKKSFVSKMMYKS